MPATSKHPTSYPLIEHLSTRADATNQSRRKLAKRLVELVEEAAQPPSLIEFLRILICHQAVAEAIGAEKTARQRMAYLEKQVALGKVLTEIANGNTPELPSNLKDSFDVASLRRAAADYREEVKIARKENRKGNPHYRISLNWPACAQALMLRTFRESLHDWAVTPWERIVGKLIGKCQVSGIDEHFIRVWVAKCGELTRSSKKSAELVRLDREGVQKELLADLRNVFPREAEDWFGPEHVVKRRGRRKLTQAAIRAYRALQVRWERAKTAGVTKLQFCEDQEPPLDPQHLETALRTLRRVGASNDADS